LLLSLPQAAIKKVIVNINSDFLEIIFVLILKIEIEIELILIIYPKKNL
jgi:Ni/Fe-hydrogenase subunit HybB-like protein